MTYILNSPLDQFEIRTFLGFESPFFNLSAVNFTNFSLYLIIILFVILGLHILTDNNEKIIGSRWFNVQEAIYGTILNMVTGQIGGSKGQSYFPFIYVLFVFILVANLIGMIPYSFAITSHLVFVVSLSFIIWFGVTIIGLRIHLLRFLGLFVPTGCPLALVPLLVLIELLSYSARAISLGLRLSANTN